MVERRVRASIAEITAREHLDAAEQHKLDEIAKQKTGQLSATMVASCTQDHWSADALYCYERARTVSEMRFCDRHLSEIQRSNVLARAGM